MNLRVVPPGIRFNDYVFTEPQRVSDWLRPHYAGVVAILERDPNWAPKAFRPLCFEEFGNTPQIRLPVNFRSMAEPSVAHLFVAVLPLPFSGTAQRCSVRDQLVAAYNPAWQSNITLADPSELARKLDELEKKHDEQTTQVRLLL